MHLGPYSSDMHLQQPPATTDLPGQLDTVNVKDVNEVGLMHQVVAQGGEGMALGHSSQLKCIKCPLVTLDQHGFNLGDTDDTYMAFSSVPDVLH